MSQTIRHRLKVKKIIQLLSGWSKKPSLDYDLSTILYEYNSIVNDGGLNFIETAIIIQSYTNILERKIDLLYRELFSLSMRLCDALSRPEEEKQPEQAPACSNAEVGQERVQIVEVANSVQASTSNHNSVQASTSNHVELNKKDKKEKPKETKRKKGNKKEEVAGTSKKITIPGLPEEILESLNLTDCNQEEVIRDCLSKLTPQHPLYSVFAKIGDEISRTKNFITYNDLSLTGKSWNILYMLENLLNKQQPLENNSEINPAEPTDTNTQPADTDTQPDDTGTEPADTGTQPSDTSVQPADTGTQPVDASSQPTDASSQPADASSQPADASSQPVDSSSQPADACSQSADTSSQPADTSSQPADIQTQLTDSAIGDMSLFTDSADIDDSMEIGEIREKQSDNQSKDVQGDLLNVSEQDPTDYGELSAKYFASMKDKPLTDLQLRKLIEAKNRIDIKDVKINLLRVPERILFRIDYFRLTSDFMKEDRRSKVERKIKKLIENPETITRKRKREMERECIRLVKKLKSYDLESFEKFCHAYYVNQGLCSPIPEKIFLERKSVDNRSEMSYGYPVTPESGRFSMSFNGDSEIEHMDLDFTHDHDYDNRRTLSRADSGCCLMSPAHDSHESQGDSGIECHDSSETLSRQENRVDSGLEFSSEPTQPEEEDPTLQKLKTMFPNAFSDPQRAELLKSLIRPPEKEKETESYVEWRNFIEEKTAREKEFNIHQYGTDILNCFPTKTINEKIDFQTVVKGKSLGNVAKYFVSALQLANTYNVEICDERQGEVRKEGFKLKFLSDERPHEEFDELSLPSESQFLENLPSTSFGHSTPFIPQLSNRTPLYCQKQIKRRRVEYT